MRDWTYRQFDEALYFWIYICSRCSILGVILAVLSVLCLPFKLFIVMWLVYGAGLSIAFAAIALIISIFRINN